MNDTLIGLISQLVLATLLGGVFFCVAFILRRKGDAGAICDDERLGRVERYIRALSRRRYSMAILLLPSLVAVLLLIVWAVAFDGSTLDGAWRWFFCWGAIFLFFVIISMVYMWKRVLLPTLLLIAMVAISSNAWAVDPLIDGQKLIAAKRYEAAAIFFSRYAREHPGDKKYTPQALVQTGRLLDAMTDRISGKAEKHCYWRRGAKRNPNCMRDEVGKLNGLFGAGAFRYEHAVTYILYTGLQYKEILKRFPKSEYVSEAKFFLLIHDLIGQPDVVLPRIKSFCKKTKRGWKDRCGLLWARANEDTWYVLRKWSWVFYNDRLAPDELLIRSEPYRQEALRTFARLKRKKGFVGESAKREWKILEENGEDRITYSIVNDSSPGTLADWGVGDLRIPSGGKIGGN